MDLGLEFLPVLFKLAVGFFNVAAARIAQKGRKPRLQLADLRLKAQLQALKEGRPPGNRVVYKALSPLERRRALEGFRAILEAQEALALRFQIRL